MELLKVLENFGFPIFCVFVLAFAVWRSVTWVAKYILQPIVTRLIKFLDDLTAAMGVQSTAMQTMAVQQGKNLDKLEDMMKLTGQLIQEVGVIVRNTDTILREVREKRNYEVTSDSVVINAPQGTSRHED